MLNIISEYGIKYEVKFNPNKTVFTIFNNKVKKSSWELNIDSKIKLILSNEEIKFEKHFKYLGVLISDDMKPERHMDSRIKSFESRLKLLGNVGLYNNDCKVDYRSMLINTYAKPVLLYGIELFTMSKVQMSIIATKLSNRLKVIYDLSTRFKSKEVLYAHKIMR